MSRGRATRSAAILASAAGLLVPLVLGWGVPAGAANNTPPEPRTPIEHLVFLFQANHSFDNYFGTRPGVDGIPKGVCLPRFVGSSQPCVAPFHIPNGTAAVLGQTQDGFERQYNGGAMNGFIQASSGSGADGTIAMGHYDGRDLPYYWNLADDYVLFDRFFASSRTGSVSNHMYAVAAAPGVQGAVEEVPKQGWGDLPTIFDRLDAAGIDWKFYIQNYDPRITFRSKQVVVDADRAAQVTRAPVLGYARYIDDPRIASHIVDLDQYYKDVAAGTLPAVSYIVPSGPSEHPPGSIQAGQRFVRSLISSLMRSQEWSSSAFFWTYDDWGGWYDHVRPPTVDSQGLGFRVPALMVSPYAKRGYVGHQTSEFSSVPAFIESNWGLQPLTQRDRTASDLMDAFDFSRPPRPPTLLTMQRGLDQPFRPFTPPVYAAYALAVAGVTALMLFASRRSARNRSQTEGAGPC